MTTQNQLSWTVLAVPEAFDRLREAGEFVPPPNEVLGDWIALLHTVDRPDAILAWREVGEPLMLEALRAESGPGSASRLTEVLRDAGGDWWRTAHAWTAFSNWNPNDYDDWSRWLADNPAPDQDRLGAMLAPTRGWLLWDFQFMAALTGAGIVWDTADTLRRAWNLRQPGIERQLADIRINGVLLEHVLLRRTLGPFHTTRRIDAQSVQRLAAWGAEAAQSARAAVASVDDRIGFTLTEAEALRVHEWAGALSAAMQDEAVEFPGVEFVFGVGPMGESLEARVDGVVLALR